MPEDIIFIKDLPTERWEEFKKLRIEAIRESPVAFSQDVSDIVNTPDKEWIEILEKALDGELLLYFVESNGELIALAGARFYTKEKIKHNAFLDSLHVSPAFREMGIGGELLKKRIEFIVERGGIKNIICEIFSSQVASIELHKKFGFTQGGTIKDFLYFEGKYSDTIFFRKSLQDGNLKK